MRADAVILFRVSIVALIVTVGCALAGCGKGGAAGTANAEGSDESLVITSVTRQDMISTVESIGQIEPVRAIDIKSKASGKILRMPVESGQVVERGALLVQVDTTEAATQVRQRSAELEYQRAQLAVAEERKARSTNLLAQGMISRDAYNADVLEYARIRSVLVSTAAALAQAEERLAETIVRAPIGGRIIEKRVEEGQIISSATSGVSEGTLLFRMADLATVRVRALMNQSDIGKMRPGQEATVVPDAYRNRRFSGRVLRVEPQSVRERDVKYFPVLVDIDNREGLLLPGMDCAVTISVSRLTNVLTIATDAVISLDDAEKLGPLLDVPDSLVKAAIVAAGGKPTGVTKTPDPAENPSSRYRTALARIPPARSGPPDAAIVFLADTVKKTARPVPVRFGAQDWNRTEIRRGLRAGMVAVVPPSAAVVQQFEAFHRMMR